MVAPEPSGRNRPLRQTFARYEMKYRLTPAQRVDVEGFQSRFTRLDPFTAACPGQRSLVRSLYFDDPAMTAFYEKIDGVARREKYRLRCYCDRPRSDQPVFLELKGRHDAQVYKHRAALRDEDRTLRDTSAAVRCATTRSLIGRLAPGPLRSRFLYDLERRRLRPLVLLDYRRRAYSGHLDPGLRLTFDEELEASRTDRLFPGSRSGSRRVEPGLALLEIKFSFYLPTWCHRMIRAFELQRVSFSKYCAAVETLGLAPRLE